MRTLIIAAALAVATGTAAHAQAQRGFEIVEHADFEICKCPDCETELVRKRFDRFWSEANRMQFKLGETALSRPEARNLWHEHCRTAIALGGEVGKGALPPGDAEIEAALQKFAALVRPTLPRKLDELTTWVSIDVVGKTTVLVYRGDLDLSEVSERDKSAFMEEYKKPVMEMTCNEKHARAAMDKGDVGYRYVLVDRQNRMIGTIEINKKACALT
jgi:hypothetical protein